MSEMAQLVDDVVNWHVVNANVHAKDGITTQQINEYLSNCWFQLTQEASELYQSCGELSSEEFYIISLDGAVMIYERWCKKWKRRFDILPIMASDDRYYAIHISDAKVPSSSVWEVFFDIEEYPSEARLVFNSLKDFILEERKN